MIISASRRTDIPAFYAEWFINRLKQGSFLVKNPYNGNSISRIAFTRESIDCIVFWTKNAEPMLSKLKTIDAMGYSYYFQFTITPYDTNIEKNLPAKSAIVDTFKRLSATIGRERVVWRYDPIIINQELSVEYHLDKFGSLCRRLSGYTGQCVFSFIDLYPKIRLKMQSIAERPAAIADKYLIGQGFAKIAAEYNLALATCCEITDFSLYTIEKAACIDQKRIENILGCALKTEKDTNQRPACNCIKSVDIGAYDCCLHGCMYCYATTHDHRVYANWQQHDRDAAIITGSLDNEKVIVTKRAESLKQLQIPLF
jgi:hypothetical protein